MRDDLQLPTRIKKQVFGFDVPVSHSLFVKIINAAEDLLEAAFHFTRRHASFLDGSIQVTSGTIFHNLAPVLILILHQIHSLDYVHMVQSGRNAEFGCELLDILFLGLVLATLAKFLRCTQ